MQIYSLNAPDQMRYQNDVDSVQGEGGPGSSSRGTVCSGNSRLYISFGACSALLRSSAGFSKDAICMTTMMCCQSASCCFQQEPATGKKAKKGKSADGASVLNTWHPEPMQEEQEEKEEEEEQAEKEDKKKKKGNESKSPAVQKKIIFPEKSMLGLGTEAHKEILTTFLVHHCQRLIILAPLQVMSQQCRACPSRTVGQTSRSLTTASSSRTRTWVLLMARCVSCFFLASPAPLFHSL